MSPLDRPLVFYTVLESAEWGDGDRCATVEVAHGRGGWSVSVRPTRRKLLGGRMFLPAGLPPPRRFFRTALHAIHSVEKRHPGENLQWGLKAHGAGVGRRPALR